MSYSSAAVDKQNEENYKEDDSNDYTCNGAGCNGAGCRCAVIVEIATWTVGWAGAINIAASVHAVLAVCITRWTHFNLYLDEFIEKIDDLKCDFITLVGSLEKNYSNQRNLVLEVNRRRYERTWI